MLLCLSPLQTLSFLDLNSVAYSCLTPQRDIFLPAQSFQNPTTEANTVSFPGGGEEIGDKGNVLHKLQPIKFFLDFLRFPLCRAVIDIC